MPALNITAWDPWQEGVDDLIQLTRSRFARKGVFITEEEGYRYFCWCYANSVDAILSQLNAEGRRMVSEVLGAVSEACSSHFRQKRLGVWDPPDTKGILAMGYRDPEHHHVQTQALRAVGEAAQQEFASKRKDHGGYL
jgi:hypothetical protein